MPDPQGNGLSMRAAAFLDALAHDFSIALLVVAVAGPTYDWPAFVLERTAGRACTVPVPPVADGAAGPGRSTPRHDVAALRSFMQPALTQLALSADAATLAGAALHADVIVVLRLYLAPLLDLLVRPAEGRRPRTILDLDDDEVTTREALARLHENRGEAGPAANEAQERDRYRVLESGWLGRFDRVSVCSEHDREVVGRRVGHAGVVVVPNAVPRSATPVAAAAPWGDARLLFVGSLGYLPNVDAAEWLALHLLPALTSRLGRPVHLDLVGRQPSAAVRALAANPAVRVYADVPDTAPFFRTASVAVAPLRAGGGTSIKVLEAFARGVPVVATPAGARGLDVVHGTHVLLADTVESFAEQCARIVEQPELAGHLVASARHLAQTTYAVDQVSRIVRDLAQ